MNPPTPCRIGLSARQHQKTGRPSRSRASGINHRSLFLFSPKVVGTRPQLILIGGCTGGTDVGTGKSAFGMSVALGQVGRQADAALA